MTKYIATDSDLNAIYGIGDSAEAAILDARTESGDPDSEYVTVPASAALVATVKRNGGARIYWCVIQHGERVGNGRANYDTCLAIVDADELIDPDDVERLQQEAGVAGDEKMVAICAAALDGDLQSYEAAWVAIEDARAQG